MKTKFFFLVASVFFMFQNVRSQSSDSIAWQLDFDQVVVTAQYAPTDSKKAIQNIRVLDRAMIDKQGATNLEQLLQQDLNVRIQQDVLLGSSASVMGVQGPNIKIMIDGVPVIGRLDGNINLSQINLHNVERVEIIEGPMAVNYGTDALGGVINIITKNNQLNPVEITLNQQVETRGETVSNIDAGIRLDDDLLLRVNGGRDHFNGFSNDTLRSSLWYPKEQWYIDASLRKDFGNDHMIRYRFAHFDEEAQNLGRVRRPTFMPYAFDDIYLTQRTDHTLSHEGSLGQNFYLQTTAAYNDFDRVVSMYRLDFSEEGEPDQKNVLISDTTLFDSWLLRSVLASKLDESKINFQLGIELRYEKGSGDRIWEEQSENPAEADIGDYAVFSSIRYQPLKKLSTEVGLRLMHNTRYDAPLIPSVHLKYDFNDDFQFRASYAKGFRSPSLKELFLSFIDINHFIIGNPNLLAETSNNIQLNFNYKHDFKGLTLGVKTQLFYNDINDQIQLFPFIEEDGVIRAVPRGQSNQLAYFNLDLSRIRGVNLKLALQKKRLQLEIGGSRIYYFNPLNDEFSEVDRYTPTTEWSGKINFKVPLVETDFSLFARVVDRFISYYEESTLEGDSARQRVEDGFSLLDATLSRRFWDDRLQLTLGVRNLLDNQQANAVGGGGGAHTDGSTVQIGPGRSFFVNARINVFSKTFKPTQ
ncbi:MAG: TonB-dependent receptor [Bacteroidota bacterium]